MVNEQKKYDCVCRKCRASFVSINENDTDGDGMCISCEQKVKNIAKMVQKNIDTIRAKRPSILPKIELPKIPGTDYINSKYLR